MENSNEKYFLSNLKRDRFDFENAYTEETPNGDSRTEYNSRTSSSTYNEEQDNSRIVIIQDLT